MEDKNELSELLSELLIEVRKIGTTGIPEFAGGGVPVSVAAKVYGKDADWVKARIIRGELPIGIATRNGKKVESVEQMNSKYGRINYYISPKKLWEDTGYIYRKPEKKRVSTGR